MGRRELGMNGEIIDAEIVDEGPPQRPSPTRPVNIQEAEWLMHMRGALADANFLITEMMGFVPTHRVKDYQERQIHIAGTLGAFDATFS